MNTTLKSAVTLALAAGTVAVAGSARSTIATVLLTARPIATRTARSSA